MIDIPKIRLVIPKTRNTITYLILCNSTANISIDSSYKNDDIMSSYRHPSLAGLCCCCNIIPSLYYQQIKVQCSYVLCLRSYIIILYLFWWNKVAWILCFIIARLRECGYLISRWFSVHHLSSKAGFNVPRLRENKFLDGFVCVCVCMSGVQWLLC